jgi:hypothetical protein
MREIHFTLPEHAGPARALGYACGLITGIVSPGYPLDQLPPKAPVQATGPISTNNPEQFRALFREGHGPGLLFGRQGAYELAHVLNSLPQACWWPICLSFAFERMQVPHKDRLLDDPCIQRGVKAFRTIYQHHLL